MEEKALQIRLEKIWQKPDFISFFEKHSKRHPLKIKKGNMIFYEGDQPERLYFIKKGFVKMYRLSEEGKNTIIYLYGPGSMLGVRALTSKDEALKHNAEAITDVEIVTISRKDYFDAVQKNPDYLIDLLHIFLDRLLQTERKLEGFITVDATARVANFLSDVAARFGKPTSPQGREKNGKVIIDLPLTHQQIAEFVGSVRETVTIALHNLEKSKLVKIEKGRIVILNPKKLKSYKSTKKS